MNIKLIRKSENAAISEKLENAATERVGTPAENCKIEQLFNQKIYLFYYFRGPLFMFSQKARFELSSNYSSAEMLVYSLWVIT